MARVLVPIVLIAALVLAYVVVTWYRRRDADLRRRAERRDALEAYQQKAALEDLERHRRRLESGLDDLHDHRRRDSGPAPGA